MAWKRPGPRSAGNWLVKLLRADRTTFFLPRTYRPSAVEEITIREPSLRV